MVNYKQNTYFFYFWKLEAPDQGANLIWVSALISISLLVHSHIKEAKELCRIYFLTALIPLMRDPHSCPNCLPKVLPLKMTTMGVRIPKCELGLRGNSNTHAITLILLFLFLLCHCNEKYIIHQLHC